MDIKQLGRIIASHRKVSGLTQAEFAKLAGVGKTVVFEIEHGKTSIRFDKLLNVLSSLNIKLEPSSPMMKEIQSELKAKKDKKSK